MKQLTEKQKVVYDYIRDFIKTHGYPPSLGEISKSCSFSPKTAFDYIKILEKKGYIEKSSKIARGIRIIEE